MKAYPVNVRRNYYRGRNPREVAKTAEYNRVATRIEEYINSDLSKQPDNSIKNYMSRMIALDLREDSDLVHRIVFSVDCGHNGATFYKGDYDLAMKALTQG